MTGESRTPAPTLVPSHIVYRELDGEQWVRWSDVQAALSSEFASPQTDHGAARTKLREWLAEDVAVAEGDAAAPAPEWRCFHCDEVFTDRDEARVHFGVEDGYGLNLSACKITIGDVRGLELEITKLRRENEELENDARLWHESNADRERRIGNRQWWQELDYREGEKLALEARLRALEQAHERLRVDVQRRYEDAKRERRACRKAKDEDGDSYHEGRADAYGHVLASLPAPEVKPHE